MGRIVHRPSFSPDAVLVGTGVDAAWVCPDEVAAVLVDHLTNADDQNVYGVQVVLRSGALLWVSTFDRVDDVSVWPVLRDEIARLIWPENLA